MIGSDKGTGLKYDGGKERMDLVPPRAFTEFTRVLTFGAKKYKANNWRKVIGWRWRYTAAGLRHVFKYMGGETHDAETNLHHLAHALCCFFFVLDNEISLSLGDKVPDGDADEVEPKWEPRKCTTCGTLARVWITPIDGTVMCLGCYNLGLETKHTPDCPHPCVHEVLRQQRAGQEEAPKKLRAGLEELKNLK